MKILQQAVKVKRGNRVLINFSRPATVLLMTEVNFKRYKDGASHRRMGGEYSKSPAEFTAPYDGTWHAVIETGSLKNPEPINGSVEVLPPLRKEIAYFDDEEENIAAPIVEDSIEESSEESSEESEGQEDSSEEEEDED